MMTIEQLDALDEKRQKKLEESITKGVDTVDASKFSPSIQKYLHANNRVYSFGRGIAYKRTIDFNPGRNNGNGMEIIDYN